MEDNRLKEIIDKTKKGEISHESGFNQLLELFDEIGCFSVEDIKDVYNMGRNAGKKKTAMNADNIGNAFLRANRFYININFV